MLFLIRFSRFKFPYNPSCVGFHQLNFSDMRFLLRRFVQMNKSTVSLLLSFPTRYGPPSP